MNKIVKLASATIVALFLQFNVSAVPVWGTYFSDCGEDYSCVVSRCDANGGGCCISCQDFCDSQCQTGRS
jgi:hypothetical protein